jgi:HK97 family phage prohead protease
MTNPIDPSIRHRFGSPEGGWIASKDGLFDYLLAQNLADEMVEEMMDGCPEEYEGMTFCISDETKDRDGDVIALKGWQLDNYRRNPVVLWAHDRSQLPVGKSLAVYESGGRLMSLDQFSEDHELGCSVKKLYRGGYLNAVSVGFMVREARPRKEGGFDILSQELLEHSAVPIPSNPNALVEARAAEGIELKALTNWAEGVLASLKPAAAPEVAVAQEAIKEAVQAASTKLFFDAGAVKSVLTQELSPVLADFRKELQRQRQRRLGSLD